MGIVSKLKKLRSDDALDEQGPPGGPSEGKLFGKLLRGRRSGEELDGDPGDQFETVNPPDEGPEYARKRYVPPGRVGHGLWIGPLGSCRTDLCADRDIRLIVNCAREVRLLGWVDFDRLQRKGIAVEHLNWLDDATQAIFPNPDLNRAVLAIDRVLEAGGQVLVNCARGVSRSATVVCAYLIIRKGLSAEDAMAMVRTARPVTDPNPHFKRQLLHIEACVRAKQSGTPSPAPASGWKGSKPRALGTPRCRTEELFS
jgi:protein-tyrosine phosphatase